jgi:hypothetical protein
MRFSAPQQAADWLNPAGRDSHSRWFSIYSRFYRREGARIDDMGLQHDSVQNVGQDIRYTLCLLDLRRSLFIISNRSWWVRVLEQYSPSVFGCHGRAHPRACSIAVCTLYLGLNSQDHTKNVGHK